MRKILVMCLVLLLAATVSGISMAGFVTLLKESGYIPPEDNLIIVETTPDGVPVEKRVAADADLFFSRALKIKAIFGAAGVEGYENEFVINLKNVSGRKLENVSLIESIPKEIAKSAEAIESDENFTVLEADPIIKFAIREFGQGETKKISYHINQNERISEAAFKRMPIPTALIKLEGKTCIGMICNDFNPCTTDSCEAGECTFGPADDGTACGEGRECFAGECIRAEDRPEGPAAEEDGKGVEEEVLPGGLTLYIGVVAVAIIAVAALIILVKKKRTK